MNKVICEICGTSYPETAEQCPICGYTQDMGNAMREGLEAAENAVSQVLLPVKEQLPQEADLESDTDLDDELAEEDLLQMQKKVPAEPEMDGPDGYEYDDEPRESSALLVFFLVLVIAALLAATAFIAFKYVLPNVLPEQTTAPAVTTEAPTQETEQPTVPCTNLVLTSGGTVVLEKEGQYWLLNVVILPVDSTDKLSYESSDESVAIVNGEGRVTALANGEAVITIRCGGQSLECRIICQFPEETTAPEVEEETENGEATEDTTEPT